MNTLNISSSTTPHSASTLLSRVINSSSNHKSALERVGFRDHSNNFANDSLIRSGKLPVAALGKLRKELGLSDEKVLSIIHMSKATASRRKFLKPEEAGRVFRISNILSLAEEVLNGHERGVRWLKSPAKFLGGVKPIELIDTEAGAEEVKNLLMRIDYSVYS